MAFPVVREQFFYPIYLNELIDHASYTVREYVKTKKSAREIADSIIRDVRYPFHLGQPDDTHVLNMYHGEFKWCRRIDADFWDRGSMVIGTNMVADCDGSSIALVTCLRAFGVRPEDTYIAFGVVRDADTNQILGGHAFVYVRDPSFGTNNFVLIETTLDSPLEKYPEAGSTVEDLKKPFRLGNIVYEPQYIFNDQFFEVVGTIMYEKLKRREKETLEKYRTIAEAWRQDTKPYAAFRKSKLRKLFKRK